MNLEELKKLRIWANAKIEINADGKKTKVPYCFNGKKIGASDNYQHLWCDYSTAKVQVNDNSADYVGLVLVEFTDKKKALVAIDIDDRSQDDFIVKDIISLMNTYTEISPSGNGFHLLFLVDTDKLPSVTDYNYKYYTKNSKINIECYVRRIY